MATKHTYRSVGVETVTVANLLARLTAPVVILALDIAKYAPVAAFADPTGACQLLVRFAHPTQTRLFLALLEGLAAAGRQLQVALEPTGTYGDALMHQCDVRGLPVFLVSPKRTHDAKEIFDGVPSQHDAKDATLIARLHAHGLSRRWVAHETTRRDLRATIALRDVYADPLQRLHDRLEPLLARHWPELAQTFDVRARKTPLYLLQQFPDPAQVRADAAGARAVILRKHPRIDPARVAACLTAAQTTLGVPMTAAERTLVTQLVTEILRLTAEVERLDAQLDAALTTDTVHVPLRQWLGATTVAVVLAYLGAPGAYASAGALEKACGLNLRERSSGTAANQGLHLTKRGPGLVRKYLFLATLRWIQRDAIARAWYQRRRGYTDEAKLRAVVALMRKLVHAIWAMRTGAAYDASKLFDTTRLAIAAADVSPTAPRVGARRSPAIQAVS
jgi:transposase